MAQDKLSVRVRGNVGADPEWIGDSQKMLKISVGITPSKNATTIWQPIIFFNNDTVKLADWAASSIRKGSKVVIDGRGNYREYTNRENQKIRTFEVIAEEFDVIQMPNAGQQQVNQNQSMSPNNGHYQQAPQQQQVSQNQGMSPNSGHYQQAPQQQQVSQNQGMSPNSGHYQQAPQQTQQDQYSRYPAK